MARKRSPARLVIALSVAAALAVFLLYTSIAGGGTPALEPSQLTGTTGKVAARRHRDRAGHRRRVRAGGLHFRLRDIDGRRRPCRSSTRGACPDLFGVGRDVVRHGQARRTASSSASRDSLVTKCPSKYPPKKSRPVTMPELGRAALVVCLGLCALRASSRASSPPHGAAAGLAASAQNALARRVRRRGRRGGRPRRGAPPARLLVHVRRRPHEPRSCRPLYTISAFWGGQEGSLLLWLLVLTGYAAAAVLLQPRRGARAVAWVVPVLGARRDVLRAAARRRREPVRRRRPRRADGPGLNPSLQNPYMVAHPPMLYLGYVGLTVPFAFAMGALLSGRTDERWIVATRRWTLIAWAFLGVGQLLGAHWAYVEVGWGGYYAWDPVENAALMPWLAATAFLHSVMVQEKKGMLKVWNMLLVVLAFCLSLFGTFLTRSGVINSIHSFTAELDRAVVPRLHLPRRRRRRSRSSSGGCRCCGRRRSSSRSSRARRRSSTTTCCSSRSA